MALVEQDAGCTSTGVKGAPAGRTAVGRAGLTQPGGRRAQSASLLLFNLQQLVWEHVTVFFPMCVPSCRVIVELLVIKRVLEREVEVEVSEVSCGPFSLGRAALSDGFALLFPLLTPSSSSCPLTSSFTGSPRGLQGSARVGSGWRGGRSTDWRAATEVCKQPCGLGSSSAFLSRRSGPPVPASCLEMLTKWWDRELSTHAWLWSQGPGNHLALLPLVNKKGLHTPASPKGPSPPGAITYITISKGQGEESEE